MEALPIPQSKSKQEEEAIPTAQKKLARRRLSALELAQKLRNVSEACRRRGITRTQFHEYKRRFQTHGLDGLVDLSPIHRWHPQTTPQETVDTILELSMTHPMWGCHRLSDQLALMGVGVSGPTIQKILDKHAMGSKYERLLKLEEQAAQQHIGLTAEQVAAIEKPSPCFRERHVESAAPGELVCQDTFYVGQVKGVGKVYLHAAVHTYGSFAFAYLHTGKLPQHAVALLYNDVLPRYEDWNIPLKAILTDNRREYCGTQAHPYDLHLGLNDIKHRRTKVRRPQTNGFVERFDRTVLDEFFREPFRSKYYRWVEALQRDLDKWVKRYNYERAHQGYRNTGKRPIDTITQFLRLVRKQA
jgi:transposase InsO family protein